MVADLKTTSRTGTLRDELWIKKVSSYYTPSQLAQYLACVGFEPLSSADDISHGAFISSMENLHRLIRLHLLSFPFENTAMHYTPDHRMDISTEGAFQRLVVERKGSYCFGHNRVLLGVLRGLGYRAYPGSARVNLSFHSPDNSAPNFTFRSHMVIFVQPHPDSNKTYLVDVGFGSSGLAQPLLLSEAEDNVVFGTSFTEKHKLICGADKESSLELSPNNPTTLNLVWYLQVWHSKDGDPSPVPWKILYSFTEDESSELDFESANYVISTQPAGMFFNSVVVVKHFLVTPEDEETSEEIPKADVGTDEASAEAMSKQAMSRVVLFGNEVKRYIGGTAVVLQTLTTELERIQALREIFGIDISDNAVEYIRGRNAAFKVTNP